jgi:hypothetical protein
MHPDENLRFVVEMCDDRLARGTPATFLAAARNFAHRFFVALPILARAAADITRFFTFSSLRGMTERFSSRSNATQLMLQLALLLFELFLFALNCCCDTASCVRTIQLAPSGCRASRFDWHR